MVEAKNESVNACLLITMTFFTLTFESKEKNFLNKFHSAICLTNDLF